MTNKFNFKDFLNLERNDMNRFFVGENLFKFNELLNYEILNESLISSYDVSKMISLILEKHFIGRSYIPQPKILFDTLDIFKTKYGYVFGFELFIKNYSDNDEKTLNKLLAYFGYFISKKLEIHAFTKLLIEPKNPIEISPILKENNITVLYHITHKSNLENIQKIGLAPKEAETSFTHPNDRIYLIFSTNINYIKAFRRTLARDKKQEENEFTIISTPFNENYKYFIDEFSTIIKDGNKFIGCFITKNIPPNDLTIENL
jgi:hypothetical protein